MYKYKKYQGEVIFDDKKHQALKKTVCDVNIVNRWPQKPSLKDKQFKKPATMYKYKKYQGEVIFDDKKHEALKKTVCEGKNCSFTQSSFMQPVKSAIQNEDLQLRQPATKSSSSLCSDKNYHSTRCFKKITRGPMRLMCGDDKNCQTTQSSNMWPVWPTFNHMQLAEPARCFNTNCYKILSNPEKRQQIQSTHVSISSIEKVQSQRRSMKPKKMQPVMQTVEN